MGEKFGGFALAKLARVAAGLGRATMGKRAGAAPGGCELLHGALHEKQAARPQYLRRLVQIKCQGAQRVAA